ncbi:hypothetical protein ACWENQ_26545 [Nonomuraea sp. NPDC004354]
MTARLDLVRRSCARDDERVTAEAFSRDPCPVCAEARRRRGPTFLPPLPEAVRLTW